MKRIIVTMVLVMLGLASIAQLKDPVKWSYSFKKIDATTVEVHMTATVEDGWHIYSQTTPDGGPVPTTIKFVKNPLAVTVGATKELGKLEQHFEKLFGVDVKQYSNSVDFVQIIKLKAAVKTSVVGSIRFMVCNNRECMPPKTISFKVALN